MSEDNGTRPFDEILADFWAESLDQAAFELKAAGWPSNRVLVADQVGGTVTRLYLCDEPQGRTVYKGDELPGVLVYTQTLVVHDTKEDGTPGRRFEIVPKWECPIDDRNRPLIPGPT